MSLSYLGPNLQIKAGQNGNAMSQIWSLDDRAYVDSLFGHQADVVALDAGRAERLLSCGQDHTCRVWKIPEESQLIFRRVQQDCMEGR